MAIDLNSAISASSNAIGSASSAIGSAGRLGSALSSAFTSDNPISAIRSINLPEAGEAIGDITEAISSFGGDANADDWRVRLSLAKWVTFKKSPVLAPLKDAGGLIFPYTPSIKIASAANYDISRTTHTNYSMQSLKIVILAK